MTEYSEEENELTATIKLGKYSHLHSGLRELFKEVIREEVKKLIEVEMRDELRKYIRDTTKEFLPKEIVEDYVNNKLRSYFSSQEVYRSFDRRIEALLVEKFGGDFEKEIYEAFERLRDRTVIKDILE